MKNSLKYVLGAMTCQGISFDMLQPILMRLANNRDACLIYQNEQIAVPQLIQRALSIVECLKKMNCQAQHIAFCLPNSPELLCWHLACLHLGIVFVPIIYEEDPKVIGKILNSTAARCLFTTALKLKKLSKIVFPVGCCIKIIDDKMKALRAITPNCSDIDKSLLDSPNAVNGDQPAMILHSLDSKGSSIEVIHNHQSFQTLVDTHALQSKAHSKMICLVSQPMGHIEGLSTALLTLFNRGTVVLLDRFEVESYLKTLKKYRPTHIHLEASLFHSIINHPNFDKDSLQNSVNCFTKSEC